MNWVRAIASVLVLGSSTAWGATLTWMPNGESDLVGYRIYRCSLQPCTQSSGNATLLATLGKGASFNIGTPAVTQYYFITAYDSANNESVSSDLATFNPAGVGAIKLAVAGVPNLPLHGTTTRVTVGIGGAMPTRVELSRDGSPPFAMWPSDSFFTMSPDGRSLTGNWCITSSCWREIAGPHVLTVVATYATGATSTAAVTVNVTDAGLSLAVAGAPDLPLHGTTTPVTVGITGKIPTRVEVSRDGRPPFATWPSDSFFTMSPDGRSLIGNWCITSGCWEEVAGPHMLTVVGTYATGATSTASVTVNVTDALSLAVAGAPDLPFHGTTTPVTVAIGDAMPTLVQLSRDGLPPFATWPSDSFFTLSPDGRSLIGNWCITSGCWGEMAGPHVLTVVATYATGATATASVTVNVTD
jgi:hypothetical protein